MSDVNICFCDRVYGEGKVTMFECGEEIPHVCAQNSNQTHVLWLTTYDSFFQASKQTSTWLGTDAA
jgi:hypothetical protein